MNKEQIKKEINEVSERSHFTQREMRSMIIIIKNTFEYVELLESRIGDLEKVNDNFLKMIK